MNTVSPMMRFLFVAAAAIVVIAGLRYASDMLVPFLLSLFIAIIASPPLSWLKDKGVPSALALVIIICGVVLVGVVVGIVIGSSINDFRADLPEYEMRMHGLLEKLQALLLGWGIELSTDLIKENLNPSVALSLAGNTLASLGNVMTNAFLILLTVIFILAEEVRLTDKLAYIQKGSTNSVDALERFTGSVNQYMAIKSSLSLLTGLLAMGLLFILDVDYPVLWGLLAFFLNFVPNLGSLLAAVPPVLLALIQLGLGDAALTALGYVLINVLIGNVLEPRVMGKGLDLSTLVVFASLVFWGWVLGPVGMLLSVPLTMTVKIALESYKDTRWLAVLLGSGKGIEPYS